MAPRIKVFDGEYRIEPEAGKNLQITLSGNGAFQLVGGPVEFDSTYGVTGPMLVTKTIADTALGTVRSVTGKMVISGTAIASGTVTGVRGELTLSGTITAGGAFLYGAQGKLIVSGTMNHADSRLAALVAQLDISAGTYTAGQLSALWVDAGATAASAHDGGGQFNMIRISNTTQAIPNSLIYFYGKASYLFDLSGSGWDWFAANTHQIDSHALSYILKVKNPAGAAGYIPVFAAVPA